MEGAHGIGGHEGGHEGGGNNKNVAILISILALLLAISETGGKSAQTLTLSSNIKASDLWSQYQAKTIRQTAVKTAAEQLETELSSLTDRVRREAVLKQIAAWKATVARYDSEPASGDGRKELSEKAKEAEHLRDVSLNKYHKFEYASAAYQIAIVLASASIITGISYLLWAAGGVGAIGLFFTLLGFVVKAAGAH